MLPYLWIKRNKIWYKRFKSYCGFFILVSLLLLALLLQVLKEIHFLIFLWPFIIGVLSSHSSNNLYDISQLLSHNASIRQLSIKSPRLWEEIEKLVASQRIKIAKDLHQKICGSAHIIALAYIEACRENLLKNDTAAVLHTISDLKTSVSDNVTRMRKYIKKLKFDSLSPKELAVINEIAGEAKPLVGIPRLEREVKKLILIERERIARDLHDEVIQNLATILIGLQLCESLVMQDMVRVAKELNSMEKLTLDSDRKIRELGFRQKSVHAKSFSLFSELQSYIKTFEEICSVEVTMQIQGKEQLVPKEVRINLMQILKEAMANVAKHAEAEKLDIKLSFRKNRAFALVIDDGRGFDAERELVQAEDFGHLGLLSMRDRARVLGGSLAIEAKPGQGSRIFVDIPFN